MCIRACVCVCVHACMRARIIVWMRVRTRACVCECTSQVSYSFWGKLLSFCLVHPSTHLSVRASVCLSLHTRTFAVTGYAASHVVYIGKFMGKCLTVHLPVCLSMHRRIFYVVGELFSLGNITYCLVRSSICVSVCASICQSVDPCIWCHRLLSVTGIWVHSRIS